MKGKYIVPFEECTKLILSKKQSLILFELFHILSHPTKSRFDDFFKKEYDENWQLNNKNEKLKNECKLNENKLELNLYKILNGTDKRTSLMIKNIPKEIDEINVIKWLLQLVRVNYIYVPKDKSNKILGFAFINVCDYIDIIELLRKLSILQSNNKLKKIGVIYSYKQGLKSLSKCFGISHIF